MNRNQIHEDSQPNEHLRRRIGSNLPPVIRSSVPPAPPPTRGNRPYRGRGGGFRGGHRGGPPTSPAAHGSLRGGGRGGPPPNSRQSLPPRPSQTTQGQQWNTNNRSEPPKPSWTPHGPNHPKPKPRPEPAPGPVAGPSNPSAPQPQPQSQAPAKRKRKWNRDPHRKHNRQQEKRRKLSPSKPSTDQLASTQPTHGDPAESTSPSTNPTIEQCISFPTETLHEVQVETRPSSSSSSHPTLLNLDPTNRGTLRISPLPSDCDSSHPLATANKTIWTARKRTELLRKGLSVTKIRIVDNALVVEWTYSVSPDTELVDWLKKQGELYFHLAPTQYRAPWTPSLMQTCDNQNSDSKPISLIPDNVTSHESLEAGPSAKRNQEQPHLATGTFSLLLSRPGEIQVELDPDSLSATGPLLKLEEDTQQLLVPLPLPSAGRIPMATALSSPSREKRERSPSPDIIPSPLRQGTYRIPYLPPECQNNQPDYEENRRKWVAREKKKMIAKGLAIQNSILSNDGLVFDWTSEVPLLPDTLLPCSDQDSEASSRPGNSKPIPIYSAPKPSTFDDSYEDLGFTRGSPPIDNESLSLNAQVSNAQAISPVSPSDHRTSGNRNDRPAPAVTRSTPSDTTKPSGRYLEDIDPSFTTLRSSSSGIQSPTDVDTSRAAGSVIQSSSSGMEFRNDLINAVMRNQVEIHESQARWPCLKPAEIRRSRR